MKFNKLFKKVLCITFVVMIMFTGKVYAANENGNGGSTTGGSSTTAASIKTQVQEKRATIKANYNEIKTLRVELKAKIAETREMLSKYLEQERLTVQEKTMAKEKIEALKTTRATLGNEYGNITRVIAAYKKDTSASKLTGLDNVIASQELRIKSLKDCIALFN